MTQSEVVLVTRLRTNNKGNQALSVAWVDLAKAAFPQATVRVFERRPSHLSRYTLADFAGSGAIEKFEAITDELARLAPSKSAAVSAASYITPHIALDETLTPKPRFLAIRRRFNLRGLAARAGFFKQAYIEQLAAAQRCALYIVNPAGEFYPSEPGPALYHLLDVYVAHKVGARTAIVNHTMDISDPTLRVLIPHVYRKLSLVGFRDEKSIVSFKAMGGGLDNVVVAPDLALTTKPPTTALPRRSGTVAISVQTAEAERLGALPGWITLVDKLQKEGFLPVLVSNEFPSDIEFLQQLQSKFGVPIEGQGLDYDAYTQLLGSYDFLISSRMHTIILAMIAGTPAVPVEGASFKITALFAELGLPATVISPTGTLWPQQVLEAAIKMRDQRSANAELTQKQMSAVQPRIYGNLIPRLQKAATA